MASKIALSTLRVAMRRGRSISARGIASATLPVLEKKTMKVPTMGDSITEGTIVEWTAQVGQGVKDGDVVALVETDKVTVEIKAEMDGVITQQFGAIDDTVEVGANLYELDTDAAATVDASSSTSETTSPEAATAPAPTKSESTPSAASAPAASSESSHRTPSIKFLGKEGWQAMLSGTKPVEAAPAAPKSPLAVTTIQDDTVFHPMYGRPSFTEAEMEAMILGGASLAPDVVAHSKGAKFTY